MSFNHKVFFGILDSTVKGLGEIPYESWLNVQYDLNVVTQEMYLDMETESDRHEAIWLLFKDALATVMFEETDNPLEEQAVGLILSMNLPQFMTFYFHLEVACLVAEGTSIPEAKKEVHDWFDEDEDSRWYENGDGTRLYFNRDETITNKPKKSKKKKKAKKKKSS